MAVSELIVWSPTFACGIKQIDDQHKELVVLVNEMFTHVVGNDLEETIYFQKVINKAVGYIKTHSKTEEYLMKLAKFSGYAEHKRVHDSFILTVLETVECYKSGKKFVLLEFTRFLKNWILEHIGVMDRQYFVPLYQFVLSVKKKKQET